MTGSTQTILLGADEGRRYELGDVTAIFKADEAETDCRYSVSEWLLAPGCEGVGPHSHDANDELFHVLEGDPEFLIGSSWERAAKGSFVRIPADIMHDFRNRGPAPARILNVFLPSGFERSMPAIESWFQAQSRSSDRASATKP